MKIFYSGFFALILFGVQHSYAQCGRALTDDTVKEIGEAKYLKDYRVRFDEPGNPKKPPQKEFTILLNKGTHYRFNIKKDSVVTDEPILKLFDYGKPYGGNFDESDGTMYEAFDFYCAKTQVYYLSVYFAKASDGCISVVVSYVNNY